MDYNHEMDRRKETQKKPQVTSYDSGQEYSIEHLIEVQKMVAASDDEKSVPGLRKAMTAVA